MINKQWKYIFVFDIVSKQFSVRRLLTRRLTPTPRLTTAACVPAAAAASARVAGLVPFQSLASNDEDYLCRKRRRKKRELVSAFIRRKLEDKVVMEDVRDGDNWSLNNVKRDVYYEE